MEGNSYHRRRFFGTAMLALAASGFTMSGFSETASQAIIDVDGYTK
jgi:hypothetical protein